VREDELNETDGMACFIKQKNKGSSQLAKNLVLQNTTGIKRMKHNEVAARDVTWWS
jgi:hypothetical protein